MSTCEMQRLHKTDHKLMLDKQLSSQLIKVDDEVYQKDGKWEDNQPNLSPHKS